jgi:hypothetical protein
MQQPKNALHSATLHCAAFLAAALKAVLPALFLATPTPAPDHPPLKSVEFLILFAFHAGF